MSSREVAGGIWKFLIGVIGFCFIAVIVFVGWLKEDIDSHQNRSAPVTAAAIPVSPIPNLALPPVSVDATKIIGKSRQEIRKHLGKPKENGQGMEVFDMGEGINVGVQYLNGHAGWMTVTSSIAGMFHASPRVLEWAHLPPVILSPGSNAYRNAEQPVSINGKTCQVSMSDQILTVRTKEFERSQ
jgi:hypothetical protein